MSDDSDAPSVEYLASSLEAARVASDVPEPPEPPPGTNGENVGQPAALAPTAAAPPGSAWCEHCQAAVEPSGRGLCPTCGRFLPGNEIALVTGLRSKKLAKIVDAYRVDLIEQLFAERGGRDALDVVSRISIENYALVCAQHKTIEERLDKDGLFTQTGRRRSAFDMLKGISETIDRLRAELPPPITRSSQDDAGLAAMPTSALELARDLLARETLTDFEQGQLAVLYGAMQNKIALAPDPKDDDARIDDGFEVLDDNAPDAEGGVMPARTPAPVPEPRCEFCRRPASRCAQISNDPVWLGAHQERPDVKAHLSKQDELRIRWG